MKTEPTLIRRAAARTDPVGALLAFLAALPRIGECVAQAKVSLERAIQSQRAIDEDHEANQREIDVMIASTMQHTGADAMPARMLLMPAGAPERLTIMARETVPKLVRPGGPIISASDLVRYWMAIEAEQGVELLGPVLDWNTEFARVGLVGLVSGGFVRLGNHVGDMPDRHSFPV